MYSRVRVGGTLEYSPTRVWRTLEYATTKEECTLEFKSCPESLAAPTPEFHAEVPQATVSVVHIFTSLIL